MDLRHQCCDAVSVFFGTPLDLCLFLCCVFVVVVIYGSPYDSELVSMTLG